MSSMTLAQQIITIGMCVHTWNNGNALSSFPYF